MSLETLTGPDFNPRGLARPGAWLVDFTAAWCAPCRAMEPVLDQLSKDLGGKVAFAEVRADDEPHIAQAFGVQAFPTFMVFRDGAPVARHVGAVSKARLRAWLEGALAQ
ncbi:MAG: thioredoxin family protein [Myxococcota bacterium]